MKGIVHFLSGLAVATFFPEAVTLAAAQSSFILVLGGIGGLLPDTLDFRLSRFLEKPDVDIGPHPANFDAQDIAERVADAINRVAGTKQKLILQLRTIRLGPDSWRQYSLRFDVENRAVIVKLGPMVNTSQMPLPEGGKADDAETRGHGDTEREDTGMRRLGDAGTGVQLLSQRGDVDAAGVVPLSHGADVGTRGQLLSQRGNVDAAEVVLLPQLARCEGRASVNAPLLPTYGEETQIDIFGGPSFELEWRKNQVEINFIPWHRQWSHSLTFAVLFGLVAGIMFGATAGAITALAYTIHIAEDQLGFLGSNLFWPFTHRRVAGLKWVHSGDAVPNFLTVWTMLLIILYNLDRFSARPLINPLTYFGIAWLPMLLLFAAYLLYRHRTDLKREEPRRGLEQTDLVQETQGVVDA